MANTLLTISMITREALRVLENQLVFTKNVTREYDDQFVRSGAKIGDTLNLRKPPRYVGRTGATLSVEDSTETSYPLQLTTQFGVDINFTSKELALQIDDFSQRFITPAVATIANKIDRDGLTMAYQSTFNATGTPGTPPTDLSSFLNAGAKLADEGCPQDGNLAAIINPWAQASLVNGLKGLFQSSERIADQYESGNMGLAAGYKFSMSQNIVSHVVGPLGGSPTVNGAGQTGPNLITQAWTAAAASRLKKGDIFTIAGVYAVNPQTRQTTNQLRQFVVTADVSSDALGAATIPIYPTMVASGQFQNVTNLPSSGAALTILGAANTVTPANMCFHKDAFVLGCADLPLPNGVDMASRVSSKKLGLSIRMVRAYDIVNDKFPCRLDVLYGWGAPLPELSCRNHS